MKVTLGVDLMNVDDICLTNLASNQKSLKQFNHLSMFFTHFNDTVLT